MIVQLRFQNFVILSSWKSVSGDSQRVIVSFKNNFIVAFIFLKKTGLES